MIGLALALQAAVPPRQSFSVNGIGNKSCATALLPENYQESYAWIMGFWSGMNGVIGGMVGAKTDGNGIVGEVKRACDLRPSEPLAVAAYDTFRVMASQ